MGFHSGHATWTHYDLRDFNLACSLSGLLASVTSLELHLPARGFDQVLSLFPHLEHLQIVLPDGNLRVDQPSVQTGLKRLRTIVLILGPEANGVQTWLRSDARGILWFIDNICVPSDSKLDELVLDHILLGTSSASTAAEIEFLLTRFSKVISACRKSPLIQFW